MSGTSSSGDGDRNGTPGAGDQTIIPGGASGQNGSGYNFPEAFPSADSEGAGIRQNRHLSGDPDDCQGP